MALPRIAPILVLWCTPIAAIASPRDELLRAVPDDYTFCVVVQNLRDEGKNGGNSFLQRLAESPLFKQLQQAPEAQKVQQVVTTLLTELGITPEQLRDDILGDAFVFAYRKGPPGQPEKEDGLILLHARDEKLLGRLVNRINELQTKSGELKGVESVDSKGHRYFKRVKAVETEPADYYALVDHKLVYSGSETLLTTTLAGLARQEKGEPAILRRMKALGADAAPVACLINPRAFDADLADSAKKGKGSDAAFVREFASYWKAVDGLGLSINFSPSFEVSLAVNARKKDLPKAANKFFTEASKRSPLWDRVPDDALFAMVGRVDVESLAAMLGAFLTDEDRAKVMEGIGDATRPFLESDDLGPLFRGLGPDVGFWVMPPDSSEKTWCPQAILAVKVADSPEGKQAEQAALKGLDFLSRLACMSQKGLRVHTERQGSVNVQYLTHTMAFPPGFRPGFASKDGYLLVAGSPRTIAGFRAPTGSAVDADEVPIIRISMSACAKYLRAHRRELVDFIAKAKGQEAAGLDQQLDAVLPILESLDRIELVQRTAADRATLILRLTESKK
jgi:hypothetical protein